MAYIINCLSSLSASYYLISIVHFLILRVVTKKTPISLLVSTAYLVFAVTVFSRSRTEYASIMLQPLWSYKQFFSDADLRAEIIANIVLFLPIGTILPFVKWRWCFPIAVLFSILIEFIQFIDHRGLAEIDDVISNTIGLIIGVAAVLAYHALKKLWKNTRSSMAHN